MDVGFAMEKPLFQWITETLQAKSPRRNGSIVACDQRLEAKSERKFYQAALTEMTVPTLDMGSKEPAWLGIKFWPEKIDLAKASGKASGADPHHPEKQLLPSNFKLEIDGLDCSKVQKIESFTIRQSVVQDAVGEQRDYQLETASLSFPNLRITFSEVGVESWMSWFEDFVVKGNCFESKEKGGKLTLLGPNPQQPLASFQLFNLGIFRLGSIDSEAAKDARKLARAEVYCERMELKLGA
jgi:hypothetical protein